ncbi:S-adenosyl-L-methionine-dependent methyltransferase [Cubamyces sp. BRFM 1775]|nr:S-adenosyl-L-methionine-dependent methyltransferase [Cubamyces sp. BRFM 1775]
MNFYFEATNVLDKLDAKKGSIKGIIASVAEKNRKRTAALVIETLKYKQVLNEVIDTAQLLKQEKKITSRNLALVLVHDLLLAGGIQAGEGPIKQAVLRHRTRLQSEFTRLKVKRGAKSNSELAQTDDARAATIPRYIRVNRTCWSTKDALAAFQAQGYQVGDPLASSKAFKQDEHIPDLFAFHPNARFTDDPLYLSGKIILQDKASCFPAYVLAPPARDDSVVIDATAAPGNKTSHLCAIMQNKGKLFAFERDRKRYSTLKNMLSKAHCSNVEAVYADFLTTSPNDEKFRGVTHILLDPSCSGSGIVNRLDHLLDNEQENEVDSERLNKLAAFQLKMIRHAMTFPSVQRIVYSTCSVHAIENEHVVREAIKTEEAVNGRFRLGRREEVFPTWHRRGIPEEMDNPDDAESVVRCSPGEDATNGFFVSLFVRGGDVAEISADTSKRKDREPDDEQRQRPAKRKRKKNKSSIVASS